MSETPALLNTRIQCGCIIRILLMTYDEIISYPRKWDRAAYPIVAHIEIDAVKFSPFERLIDDQTQTRCSVTIWSLPTGLSSTWPAPPRG